MSCIEQVMNVHSHSKSVSYGIFAMILERHDMCSLQDFRHFYISDNASSIGSKNFSSETSLVRSELSFYKFPLGIRHDFI